MTGVADIAQQTSQAHIDSIYLDLDMSHKFPIIPLINIADLASSVRHHFIKFNLSFQIRDYFCSYGYTIDDAPSRR